ncbi:MAG: DUF1178 family protein [Desulfobacterales bacterium]|nr:DUF1178 family protein [Desulfobacterales bacterium]
MIVFDLQCQNNHTFEGWFEDGKAFDAQQEKGLILCPVCSNAKVLRLPSKFSLKSVQTSPLSTRDPLEDMSSRLIEYIEKNFDDVGSEFAREALKIHYGAADPRSIRGVSTKEEEKTLKEEGIQFFKIPLPTLPPDSDA